MYGKNPRIGDLFVLPDIGTYLQFRPESCPVFAATHGYDNFAPEMEAICSRLLMMEIAWLFQHCSDKYNLLSSECKSDSEGHYLSGNNHTSIVKPLNHRPFALSRIGFRP